MTYQTSDAGFSAGMPVVFGNMANPDKTGWIAEITPKNENMRVFTLGSGAMVQERFDIVIAWENLTYSEVSEGIAGPWIEKAAKYGCSAKPVEEVAQLLEQAKEAEAKRRSEQVAEREAAEERVSAWRDSIRDKIPTWAKSVIIGQLEIDDCDSMTDYFNTKTDKTVILGFSKHNRDLFPEMRKAARNYSETEHLADAGPDAEHREKYSMGAGYYLKATHRYSTGWKVCKHSIGTRGNDIAASIPVGEWHVPDNIEEPDQKTQPESRAIPTATTVDGFTITEHTHTKRGFQMWIVAAGERVTRETFQEWLDKAKDRKGWYSRKWGKTPAGFAFKDQEQAKEFAAEVAG